MLTQKARYALHAMLFLAAAEGSATVTEIAEGKAILRKFLEQILSDLRLRGWVIGKRVSGGRICHPHDARTPADGGRWGADFAGGRLPDLASDVGMGRQGGASKS